MSKAKSKSIAKELQIIKLNECHQNEFYLGRLSFHDEFRRSCEEFDTVLRNVWDSVLQNFST